MVKTIYDQKLRFSIPPIFIIDGSKTFFSAYTEKLKIFFFVILKALMLKLAFINDSIA